jgi:hypothetical protein
LNEYHGWFNVLKSQVAFPDMILEDGNGIIRAEVERNSSDFISHQHDPDGCDLIICWRHNWNDCPLPVMTISVEWENYCQLKKVKRHLIMNNGKLEIQV